tara:strand:+ start:377 stop:1000 length:624 start_codon:yes stop_codon:yes gene_type:complete
MSEQVELTNPVDLSIGGFKGHVFRRIFHLSMCVIPVLYFEYGQDLADKVSMNLDEIVSVFVIAAILGEALRLKLGFTVFGQREYESTQVSALAWGAIAIGMVLLMTPVKEYAYPLIFSLAFGDPFMGELRRREVESKNVITYACVLVLAIWLLCWNLFDTPLILCFIAAPIAVISETPRLRYIDDNATMLLIPLALVIILEPFLHVM